MLRSTLIGLSTFSTLIAFAVFGFAQPVSAQEQQDDLTPTRRVVVRDLDLSSEAGRSTLNHRIEIAVRQVCRPMEGAEIPSDALIAKCRRDARARARPQVENRIAFYNNHKQMASLNR